MNWKFQHLANSGVKTGKSMYNLRKENSIMER